MGQFFAFGLGVIPWLLMPDLSASIFCCSVPVLLCILEIFQVNISENVSEEHTANSVCMQLWGKKESSYDEDDDNGGGAIQLKEMVWGF